MSSVADLLEPNTCRHGGRDGRRPDGKPWCPICRHHEARAARLQEERDRRLPRFGWRDGRPPVDPKMRAANDDTHRD